MTILRDEFEIWIEHPITQWLLNGLRAESEALKAGWLEAAWDQDMLDPIEKTRSHARWDIMNQIAGITYEDACAYTGQVPLDEEA